MSKNFQVLADNISKSYIKAGADSVGLPEASIEGTHAEPLPKAIKPIKLSKRMPKNFDGKIYALPGEIIAKQIDKLSVGQNAFVSIECVESSKITSRDFDYSQEVEALKKMSKDELKARLESQMEIRGANGNENLELGQEQQTGKAEKSEKNSDTPARTLTKFQELYLDLEKNGQVDAIKVYLSKDGGLKLVPIEGNRRLFALQKLGYSYVYVTLYPEPANALELVKLSQSFNQKRDRHSIFDLGKQWSTLVEAKIKQEAIAKEMGTSPGYVSKALTVNALYSGTRRALQENPDLFSERLVILVALFNSALEKEGISDAWRITLKAVITAIDLKLKPKEIEELISSKKLQYLSKDNSAEQSQSPVQTKSPFKQSSKLYIGELSTPAGFLTVDSESKSIRVGVDFSMLMSPQDFLSDVQELMEKHGLRKSIEPKIFNEAQIGERLESLSKKGEGPTTEINADPQEKNVV